MTKAERARIIRITQKHSIALGKHRDALRALVEEAEGFADCADRAIDALHEAADVLSELI